MSILKKYLLNFQKEKYTNEKYGKRRFGLGIYSMKLFSFLSDMILPLFLFLIVGYALLCKRDIFEDFLEGAADGLRMVVRILPSLLGVVTAVGVLRASTLLDQIGTLAGSLSERVGIPGKLMPLALVRLFSSGAATGLLLDIFKESGADSAVGWMAALMMGATESVFYCMSVYFGSVGIKRTGYTLPGALRASLAGLLAAVWVVQRWGVMV
jgi:spore maturation protein B